jgi:hypothetical protein
MGIKKDQAVRIRRGVGRGHKVIKESRNEERKVVV